MTPEKNKLLFSALLFLTGLFFYTPLKADSIPATETITAGLECRAVSNVYTQNGATPQTSGVYWTISSSAFPSPSAERLAAEEQCESVAQVFTYGDTCVFDGETTQSLSSVTVSKKYKCGFNTYRSIPVAEVWSVPTHTEYTCDNPQYPDLQGTECFSIEPEDCSTQPILNAVNNFTSLCVTVNETTGQSCSFEQIENSFGALSGTFLPNGSGCECADSPDGQCYTPQEPPFPEGEECGVFGNYVWCSADPSQCQSTLSAGGGVIPCGNCGTVNDTFMCIAGDAPEAERCSANDPRPECLGASEGDCPTGYQCDPPEANTDDTENRDQPACTLGDTRPECIGVPEGQPPTQSEETAQLEQLNSQMDDMRSGLGELNKTAKEIRDRQLGPEDLPGISSDIESQEAQHIGDLTNAINDTTQQDTFIDGITSQFNGVTGTLSGSLLPQLGCNPINISLPFSSGSAVLPICEVGDYVRPILAWIFALLTITRLFSIIYQTLIRGND